jgi:hypothetical protein
MILHWFDLLLLVPCCLFLGFFGDQAVRLLRESWDGVLHADPSTGDIRPVGATELALELFAMLDDKVPQNQVGPVTMTPNPGVTPLTIVGATPPSNGIVMDGSNLDFSRGGGITLPEGSPLKITGDGMTITGSLNLNGGFYLWNGVPLDMAKPGTTTFLAKVVSGSGGTYLVNIYGNGSTQPPTNPQPGGKVNVKDKTSGPPVTATIPQFNSMDSLPAGTWISALYEFTLPTDPPTTTYEFQPAIWLS